MRPRDEINTRAEKRETDHDHTSTPPQTVSDSSFSCNETPSWFDSPGSERKQRTSILRRLRTVSTASSSYSLSPTISSVAATEVCSRPASPDWRRGPISPNYDGADKAAKSIISWGSRLLRRHGSVLALSSLILKEESARGSMEISETCQRAQLCPIRSKLLGKDLKRTISTPFDFHHVTHTQSRHFETLDRGSQNELITEFVAIRASQRPKSTLQGIYADDVRNGNDPKPINEGMRRCGTKKENSLASLTRLSDSSASAQALPSSSRPAKGLRSSPSIENFSRPAPWSPTSPRSPPPRVSSRNALELSPPKRLKNKSSQVTIQQPTGDLRAGASTCPNAAVDVNDSHGQTAHAVTKVEAAGIPLETWPLPAASPALIAAPMPEAKTAAEHQVKGARGRSVSLPLRHSHSFPSIKILSQHDHKNDSHNHEEVKEVRPESLQPMSTGQWEDDVDYCYDNAVQADSNFDWNQKTVYVDDIDSSDAPASSDHQVEGWIAPNDAQAQSPGRAELQPRREAFRPRASTSRQPFSRRASKKSVSELETRLSPFGRHQATSEFRGYQHLTQTSSRPTPKLHIASQDISGDDNAFFVEEAYDYVELGTLTEDGVTPNRCHSGGSSSFRAARPLLNKYRSDGSMLSSAASTIRTCRSSNSIASVPDLISSPSSSRDSVTFERTSPTDAINSGTHQVRDRAASASQSQMELRRLTADLPPLPCFYPAMSPKEPVEKAASTAPTAPSPLAQTPPEAVDQQKKMVGVLRTKSQPVSRTRSASAVTPGHHLVPRGSYSLFPNASSSVRSP